MITFIIYFHIYNAYYQDGNFKNDIPPLTAYGIVGCSLSLIIAALVNLIKFSIISRKLSNQEYLLVVIPSMVLFYFLLSHKKKYETIYQKLKNSSFDKLLIKVLAWSIIFFGLLSFVLIAYLFKNISS
jgi:hypothetical protein